jgi:hypothetical protein
LVAVEQANDDESISDQGLLICSDGIFMEPARRLQRYQAAIVRRVCAHLFCALESASD